MSFFMFAITEYQYFVLCDPDRRGEGSSSSGD